MTFSEQVIQFHFNLDPQIKLHDGIEWIHPFHQEETRNSFESFFRKYYSDSLPRTFIFGINPGRFGAGITGVPFTDPIRLETECGILNDYNKRQELSSVFIYELIERMGGVQSFYERFYITSLSPLGFLKDKKNYNYYDDRVLLNKVEPFIIENIKTQIEFGAKRHIAFSLGKGKNYKFFKAWNDEYQFFQDVIPLPHPRWVMQYKLKRKVEFIEEVAIQLLKS